MPNRKVALHGLITGAPKSTVQKYIITITGELNDAASSKEAKITIYNAVKRAAKEIPGAREFWVGQPRGPRKNVRCRAHLLQGKLGRQRRTHMTPEEHKARHIMLHRMLDELIADFIVHTESLPSKTPLMDLMEWSHGQTLNPTEAP